MYAKVCARVSFPLKKSSKDSFDCDFLVLDLISFFMHVFSLANLWTIFGLFGELFVLFVVNQMRKPPMGGFRFIEGDVR